MSERAAAGDAWRLAVGTLSVLRVRPPSRVDARVGAGAMTLAPVVGAGLALPAAALVGASAALERSPLIAAVLVVALGAVLTRALHLDGLADTADGLGSGRRGDAAVQIMRASDIGPFGVVTLLLALLAQVAAIATLASTLEPVAAAGVVFALLAGSRAVLPWACGPWFPAARTDGLGTGVAATLPAGRALATSALGALAPAAVAVALVALAGAALTPLLAPLLLGAGVGHGAAVLLAVRVRGRLGGVTGDVYGACVETCTTVALVTAALLV